MWRPPRSWWSAATALQIFGCSNPRPAAERHEEVPPIMATALARLDDMGMLAGKEETGDFLADERRALRRILAAQRAYGPDDPSVSQALGALASLYERHGRLDEYGVMRGLMLTAWANRPDFDAP